MPVIRGQSAASALTQERRDELLRQLEQELAGQGAAEGPLIFEIPLEQSAKMDVVVVWQAFAPLLSEDRTSLILAAYAGKQADISLALGVTREEALEQQILPYLVVPMARLGEAAAVELRKAMIEEGGIAISPGTVELRLPTMAMAEAAHRRLCDRMPQGYWSIVQTAAATV
jgi:hypothetical protein